METLLAPTNQTAILGRSFDRQADAMSLEVARFIMSIELADHDRQRLEQLAEMARHDRLTESDRNELDEYLRAGRLMEMMKLKARIALKKIL